MTPFALLMLAPLPQDPAAGIARELARERAALVREVEYDLTFKIVPGANEVTGTAAIRFRLPADRDPGPLVLDFGGSELGDVAVNGKTATLRAVHDHVLIPPDLLGRDRNLVTASFRSAVAATGTPLTVYRDATDDREYWYTLVVPADAHRLWPCFDQPDLRAVFRFELDLPRDWTAISNTTPLAPETRADGTVRWRFPATKPLPTYLAAFACGPFAAIEVPQPTAPGITSEQPMRILLRPSQLAHADRDTLVKLHHDGLAWLSREFDVPYPFAKLDIALLPGFPYGGMEHAGAIFYREQALVFDHPPTAAERVRRSTLVYHELAHQWFGNLVTMRWFDDLWLKEGFATFVGHQAMAALEPDQRPWLRFAQRVKPRAYEVDGTPGTTPVFQELQNLADAKSAYGAIVYNKAPAVLRALHERLGAAAFRSGLKRFLEQHAFGNAEWRDLAAALEGASRADLTRWSDRWLLAPSMPQVRVVLQNGDDGRVKAAAVEQKALGGDGTWPLDLELLVIAADGARSTLRVRSDAASVPVPELAGKPAPLAVLANPRDVAYGQFVPDATSREWLLAHALDESDPEVRAAATGGLLEAVRETELDPARFADFLLRAVANERDADTHGWLLDALGTTLGRWLADERAAPLRTRASELLRQQLSRATNPGCELQTFRFLARNAPDPGVLGLCSAIVARAPLPAGLAPGKQDAFLAAAALLANGRAALGEDAIAALTARFAGEDVGKEVFLARAATPTAEAKKDYFARYLDLGQPPEQWTQDSLSWFHWPQQHALTLPFLRPALDKVDWVKANRRIFFMPAWLDGFINGHSSPEALAIVDDFLATAELSPDIRQKLLQSRDGLARAVRIRRRSARTAGSPAAAGPAGPAAAKVSTRHRGIPVAAVPASRAGRYPARRSKSPRTRHRPEGPTRRSGALRGDDPPDRFRGAHRWSGTTPRPGPIAMTATANDFHSLGLTEPLLKALAAKSYTTPTPIQARAIPHLLSGRDLFGIAQTGTGKTAAFALPMLQLLTASNYRAQPRRPRSLVLAPTRELATQIADSFNAYGRFLHQRVAVVFGGVGQAPQVDALRRGLDVLVATPGRLLDLMQQRHCELGDVEILVLDEADRMLDMGFLPDVKRILATLPAERQSLLFSATMPADITALAARFLRDPLRIEVAPPAATADRIEQSVHFVSKAKKRDLLVALLQDPAFVRTLVFTRTKHGADRVAKSLHQAGFDAHAIHGNKSQNARERALDAFRDGKAHVLVATDIAARGIDVPDITHVINFDLPNIPESYVHRIGRTARAGRAGIAISFCDEGEREYLRDIEKLIKKRIPVAG
ncbi:MAG: M1 family aminopeptidase, partial [Planctomycetota bacterium]